VARQSGGEAIGWRGNRAIPPAVLRRPRIGVHPAPPAVNFLQKNSENSGTAGAGEGPGPTVTGWASRPGGASVYNR
jgi:hypothetical protein